jgi:hypothetical protein
MVSREEQVPPQSSLILYQGEDRATRIEVRLEGGTVWLTQLQLAELYQTSVPNINQHLAELYEEDELDEAATIKQYLIVRREGARDVRRDVLHYSLEAIIAVGFRVRSHRGTQFRQWATDRLAEYVVKGFAMDDERLKAAAGSGERYFDELLDRIRDIRSSERVFWRKVLDIYATSVDYDASAAASERFFATVQNKMHWAAHGQTAAEVVYRRVDASKPSMGLTSVHSSGRVRRQDVAIAKNYLTVEELDTLNRIVSAYLEFAELQARGRRSMYMADWIAKLDDFLRISEREILSHAGTISHEVAQLKAESELELFRKAQDALPQPVDADFEEVVKRLPKTKVPKKPKEKLE